MNEQEKKQVKLSIQGILVLTFIIIIIIGSISAYLAYADKTVYIEKSDIEAPLINLSANSAGILNDVFVKSGDIVKENTVVARIGDQLIKTKIPGLIIKADAAIGQSYASNQSIITMIDPTQLRVVGHIDENKGLENIKVGQYVNFTVDTFGSKNYTGIVDEISPEARSGDIVFTISDKRQEQVFDIKVRFNTNQYPELKNGMSARIWITK